MPRYMTIEADEEHSCPECGGDVEEDGGDRFCLECDWWEQEDEEDSEERDEDDDGW